MRILLIYPSNKSEVSHISIRQIDRERGFLPPLGLLFVATYLKKNSDHDIKVIDCNVDAVSYEVLPELIEDFNPDVVGISTITHHLVDAYKVAAIVKGISKKIIN